MDIVSIMKQLKSMEQEYEKLKKELSEKEYIVQRAGILVKFDGLGNIKALEISQEISSKPIKDFKEDLRLIMEEYQSMVKDNITNSAKSKFLGSLPFGF